jgi:RHS repeat-associated protein
VLLFAAKSFAAVSPQSVSNAPGKESSTAQKEPPAGDPVGLVTGSVYERACDLAVSCPDIDLVMLRSYTSALQSDTGLGYGWTHAYDWRVEKAGSKMLVRSAGEGGVTDTAHVFPVPSVGATVWNADGYSLFLGTDGRYIATTPGMTRYAFDSANRLESIETWNGTRIAINRAAPSDRVTNAVHSCGKFLAFEYDASGRLSRVTTPDPAVYAEYSVEPFGARHVLGSVVRRDGGTASTNLYRYSGMPSPGLKRVPPKGAFYIASPFPPSQTRPPVLTGKTDANGIEGAFKYIRPNDSPFVKCAFTELSDGFFETSLSFKNGETTEEKPTAAGIVRTTLKYDANLREIERATAATKLSKERDSTGRIVKETLSDSSTGAYGETRVAYDARSRPVSAGSAYRAAPTRFTTLAWDDRRNVPSRIVSPAGRIWEWTTNGNEIVIHGAGTNDARDVTHVVLDGSERPVSIVFPDGGAMEMSYDASGYATNVSASALPPVAFGRDALGFVDSVSAPGPDGTTRMVSAENNWRGNPLSVTHLDGTSETFEYEGNGRRVTRHIDALGRENVYKWVLGYPVRAGRVVNGVTNSLFGVDYDKQLNVLAITDPLGRDAERYVIDENERTIAVTNVEGQAMTREYLLGGLVSSETRFDGTEVHYCYDTDGNLASLSFPGETLSFAYDIDGLLVSASNSVGVVSNSFDTATGWLAASVGADGTEVSYVRRNGGGVAAVSSVAGTTAYAYDAANRTTRISSSGVSFGFGYCDWNGMLASVTNASGLVTEYAYDVMDRVTNISWRTSNGASLGGFDYEYDAVGRIVSRSHALGTNAFNRAYTYDDLDRLSSDGGVSYTYDAAGNRTTKTENGETITYFLGVGDRLASWTDGAYSYDVAGCVTRIERDGKPTLDLTWNGQYQLVSVSTNGVFAESYAYDALGRRVSTTTAEGTTRHVYDDKWQVVADLDEHNNVIASYTWGDGIDNLLAVKVGGASYYPLTDIQGTVWGYIDSQNNVVACWQYDAWGNVVEEDVAIPVLASLRYRFQGREWSAATGLVNFRMRWYDPETGRWLSKDPIGLSGGLNLYSFCGENPLTFIDPLGRSFWPEAIDRWGRFNRCVNPGLIGSWIWHHYVREYFNAPLPETPPSVEGTGWRKLSRKESVFHDNGDEYEECKYVHKDGREVVYDGRTNEIITDTVYKGTYNFVNPGTADDGWIEYSARFVGHGVLDVIPYLIMGN